MMRSGHYRGQWGTNDDYPAWNKANSNLMAFYLADVPVLGPMLQKADQRRMLDDYMRNRGLTWSDVKYPTQVLGAGAWSSTFGAVSFVSRNIMRLYR